jgi:hypothetical protein
MSREVELWDEEFQRELVLRNMELVGITLNPLEQFDGPTARDIVRNLDFLDLLVFHGGQEDVIHVDKPCTK